MKNIKNKILLIIIAGVLGLFACKKDTQTIDPIIDPAPTPVSSELQSFFDDNVKNMYQKFTIDAATPQLITGSKGTKVQFYANSFQTLSGGAVTGNVDIELIEIFDKSDMIFANMPTMGVNYSGNYEPLISGGEFRINASQNGNELKLKPYVNYNVEVPAPSGTTPNMGIFYGEEANDTLIWDPADSGIIQGTGSAYNCFFDSLGPINCDYFGNDPRPQTIVKAKLPSGFTNKTCMVFISFDNLKSITSFYNFSGDTYNTGPYYKLPIGLKAHFVAFTIIGGNVQASIVPVTITNNHLTTIPALTPLTNAQFKLAIDNLP